MNFYLIAGKRNLILINPRTIWPISFFIFKEVRTAIFASDNENTGLVLPLLFLQIKSFLSQLFMAFLGQDAEENIAISPLLQE